MVGENKFKGLGIFAKDNVKLELQDLDDGGFFDEDIIICGDFNCDARLKRMHAKKVHMVVETLKKHNLVDTYHYLNDEVQGEETKATFFMYRH